MIRCNLEGKQEGPLTIYYEDGSIAQTCEYKDNLLTNELRIYYPNGNLKEISNWQMDKPNGLFVRYFKDGKIRQKGIMKNGEKIGDWILND